MRQEDAYTAFTEAFWVGHGHKSQQRQVWGDVVQALDEFMLITGWCAQDHTNRSRHLETILGGVRPSGELAHLHRLASDAPLVQLCRQFTQKLPAASTQDWRPPGRLSGMLFVASCGVHAPLCCQISECRLGCAVSGRSNSVISMPIGAFVLHCSNRSLTTSALFESVLLSSNVYLRCSCCS